MNDKIFIDTNVFVYAFIDHGKKCKQAKKLFDKFFGSFIVSTQVLSEFYNVLSKSRIEHKQIVTAVSEITTFCEVISVSMNTIQKAFIIKEKYGYNYWDCLILSSALESSCKEIFSEDMHDGQLIEDTLRIINIFENT